MCQIKYKLSTESLFVRGFKYKTLSRKVWSDLGGRIGVLNIIIHLEIKTRSIIDGLLMV